MNDLNRALADIADIREQIAAARLFRGFGPGVIAATGIVAVVTAFTQSLSSIAGPDAQSRFFFVWILTAVVSIALIGIEMIARSRRHHGALAAEMMMHAVEQFIPALAAGAALAIVILRFAPDNAWMLPGLWQMLTALGAFAALRKLPRNVAFVGAWYFLAGLACLMLASETRHVSPWLMGVPYGVGQLLMAGVLYQAGRDAP